MKEVTYEDWQKNPTPRMMWVWDCDVRNKVKHKVIYLTKEEDYPVVSITDNNYFCDTYAHCAEIEEPKTRRMTKQEFARWFMNGIKEGKYREWRYMYGSVVFNFGSFNYQIDEDSSPVDSDILIREDGGEWREPLVEVEK